MLHYFCMKMKSPVGSLKLVADDQRLIAVLWEKDSPERVKLPSLVSDPAHPILLEAKKQLNEYFAGERRSFQLPVRETGTEFQKKVLRALQRVPYGETRSYSQLADQIGSPRAVRAVGSANARNPLSIIYPCHRVVGKSGALTGFAGGLKNKRILLELEMSRKSDRPILKAKNFPKKGVSGEVASS